ncbi:MAG: tyrosine-type recombinase/integrase [Alphaproteobacteria bacterium]|nr:tyrosine-type recombinase/integrase [Alphaproteobacteria bacterium]
MRAKILTESQLQDVLAHARPMMRVAVLTSFRCGLRAKELAALDWAMVLDARGLIGEYVDLPPISSKGRCGAGRLPITPDLRDALAALWRARRMPLAGPVLCDDHLGRLTPDAVRFRLNALYEKAGLHGVSSHSGRRTFGTALASKVNLPSVQKALRHARPATTLLYVDAVSDHELTDAIHSLAR